MKSLIQSFSLMLIVVLTVTVSAPVAAQDRGDGGNDRASERDGDRRGDRDRRQRWEDMSEEEREEMRKRMEERRAEYEKRRSEEMRERLGMSEDEFEIINPMIDKVRGLMRERQMASGNRGRGFFGGSGEVSDEAKSASEAMAELRQAIEDDNKGDIKDALEKLRRARTAMDAKIKEAREELRSVLTPKWEASLVVMGVLD